MRSDLLTTAHGTVRCPNSCGLPTLIPGHRLVESTIRQMGLEPTFVYLTDDAPDSMILCEGYFALWRHDGVVWPLPCVSCWGDRGAYVCVAHLVGSGWWSAGEAWRYEAVNRLALEKRVGHELAQVFRLFNGGGDA